MIRRSSLSIRRAVLALLTWGLDRPELAATARINRLLHQRVALGRRMEDWLDMAGVTVGKHTYGLRRECLMFYGEHDRVTIGRYCSVAEGVRFVFGEHPLGSVSTFPFRERLGIGGNGEAGEPRSEPIEIGHDVWIGQGATILSGVKVGSGAVIGAGAVVARDVPPYAIVVGNPAKVIRMRFEPRTIERLLALAWWDWDEEEVRLRVGELQGRPDPLLDRFERSGSSGLRQGGSQ